MRLFQTADPVLAFVAVILVHLLLLGIHQRDNFQPGVQPIGEAHRLVRDQFLHFFQPFHGQRNVMQLLTNCLAAFCFGPLLAFRQIQV